MAFGSFCPIYFSILAVAKQVSSHISKAHAVPLSLQFCLTFVFSPLHLLPQDLIYVRQALYNGDTSLALNFFFETWVC